MDLEFYVRVRTCEKRVNGKQPLESPAYESRLHDYVVAGKSFLEILNNRGHRIAPCGTP